MSIPDLRKEYTQRGLDEHDVVADPIEQFRRWFGEAAAAGLIEPNAMTLATVGADGHPAARVVLMKDYGPDGFVFYCNYDSPKSVDLTFNPAASLSFYWPELERQVRILGTAARLGPEESDAYFAERPAGSQLGAWASPQSQVISGRAELEARFAATAAHFLNEPLRRPPHWGGYRVRPQSVEFWQGRISRLHDRIRYRLADGGWLIERLAP
ncbi:MAG: pyridoxamine 5'-phosphate oxidase [Oscillochloris sp.]|nr:pyridoxamine 5'-phosphate oxidase [Oscillochloris sp.]